MTDNTALDQEEKAIHDDSHHSYEIHNDFDDQLKGDLNESNEDKITPINKSNAYLFWTGKIPIETFKELLNPDGHNCHWIDVEKVFTCSKEKWIFVETYLKNKQIFFFSELGYDSFFDLTVDLQKKKRKEGSLLSKRQLTCLNA